jgi:hypothetical protein
MFDYSGVQFPHHSLLTLGVAVLGNLGIASLRFLGLHVGYVPIVKRKRKCVLYLCRRGGGANTHIGMSSSIILELGRFMFKHCPFVFGACCFASQHGPP